MNIQTYGLRYNIKTKPYEGIKELFDELESRKILLAINSNKPDEYTKDDIVTQIRVHDDVIHFMNSSIILEECDDPETAFYVYDDPDEQNYVFTLEEHKVFSTKKIRIDKNLTTGEFIYWLNVIQGEQAGWTLMAKTTQMISRVYEDDSLNAKVVFFPYDKKKRPFYVLRVSSGCELETGIYLLNQPVHGYSDSIDIEGTFDSPERIEKFISIKALAVEKPEDLDDLSKIWYLVVSGDKKGWYQGSYRLCSVRRSVHVQRPCG